MKTGVSEPRSIFLGPPAVHAGLTALATAILDLVFPSLCPVCESRLGPGRHDPLCGGCWDAIARIAPPYCEVCGSPCTTWASAIGPCARQSPCARCAAEPPVYDYARSAAAYAGPLREALHAFKFSGKRALARPLGDLALEQCAEGLGEAIAAVVPVPLARERERERGFNQARLLAGRVASRLVVPLKPRWLVRVRATRPQSDLSADERRANVRGAFHASQAAAGLHVLVVDDVFTTGATLAECARALREAGASRIGLLTVARVL